MTNQKKYIFPKSYHLCGSKRIDGLRDKQTRIKAYPLLGAYSTAAPSARPNVQVLIVAPKKVMRHAVDRNRAKRFVRESLRLQLPDLIEKLRCRGIYLDLSIIVVGPLKSFSNTQLLITQILEKLREALSLHNERQ